MEFNFLNNCVKFDINRCNIGFTAWKINSNNINFKFFDYCFYSSPIELCPFSLWMAVLFLNVWYKYILQICKLESLEFHHIIIRNNFISCIVYSPLGLKLNITI